MKRRFLRLLKLILANKMLSAKRIFSWIALFSLCCLSSAWAIPAHELTLNRPVIDQAQLLDSQTVERIENKLYDLRDKGLMQAAVVIVDTTDGVEPFDYALRLARRWQLGSAKADNGLLFLIALQDRRFQMVTGKGLEGALPDVSLARAQRTQLVPAFRQGQYAQGIENTLNTLITQLEADPETRAQMIRADKQANEDPLEQILPSAMMIFVICLFLAQLLGAVISGAIGGATVAGLSFVGFQLGAVSLIFGLFFFIAFMFFYGIRQSNGGRPIIITSGGNSYGHIGGFGTGRSYGGGGGGFSGGGAGGSW